MTRKKFVKQLMARGMSRNLAESMACICRAEEISYKQGLEKYRPHADVIYAMSNFIAADRKSVAAVVKNIKYWAACLAEAFAALPPCYLREIAQETVVQLAALAELGGGGYD